MTVSLRHQLIGGGLFYFNTADQIVAEVTYDKKVDNYCVKQRFPIQLPTLYFKHIRAVEYRVLSDYIESGGE